MPPDYRMLTQNRQQPDLATSFVKGMQISGTLADMARKNRQEKVMQAKEEGLQAMFKEEAPKNREELFGYTQRMRQFDTKTASQVNKDMTSIFQDKEKAQREKMEMGSKLASQWMKRSPQQKMAEWPQMQKYLKKNNMLDEEMANTMDYSPSVDRKFQVMGMGAGLYGKGPMSLEDKMALIDYRYGTKGTFEQKKSDIRVSQDLTQAQVQSADLAEQKNAREIEKLTLEAKKYGLNVVKSSREDEKLAIKQRQDERAARKADREQDVAERRERKASFAEQSFTKGLTDYAKLADDLIKNTSLNRATGAWTYLPTMRGGKTADIEASLKTLKSKAAISALNEMKSHSTSGASGMGALSERELDVLIDAYTTIQTTQGVDAMRKQLAVIRDRTNALVKSMQADGSANYYKKASKPQLDPSIPSFKSESEAENSALTRPVTVYINGRKAVLR